MLQTSQWKDDSPMLFSGNAGAGDVESSDERCGGRAPSPPSISILRSLSILHQMQVLTLEHAKMMQKMHCYLPFPPIESTPFQRSLARRDPSNLDGTPTVRARRAWCFVVSLSILGLLARLPSRATSSLTLHTHPRVGRTKLYFAEFSCCAISCASV